MKTEIKLKTLILFLGIVLVIGLVGSAWLIQKNKSNPLPGSMSSFLTKPVLAEEIYPLFLCPCCGQPLDKNNICCEQAKEMIDYIDSQVSAGLSKNDVILKTVEKYGLTSVVESKRTEIKEELAKRNPDLFPKENLSFNEAVGKRAPEFSLENLDGKTVKLSDFRGKVVVLFFNEGAMCYPACWEQMAAFTADERFNSDEVMAFSIVVDPKTDWQKITEKVPQLALARILFDTTKAVSSAYDVLSLSSSMHPGSFPGHTYFVIDKEGIIRYAFDDPMMGIRNDEIFKEVEKLL